MLRESNYSLLKVLLFLGIGFGSGVFKCSAQTGSINITWEHVRSANYGANARPANSETLVVESRNLCLMSPPSDSKAGSSVRPTEIGWRRRKHQFCYFFLDCFLFSAFVKSHISVDCLSTCCFLLAFHSWQCSNSYMWSKRSASG